MFCPGGHCAWLHGKHFPPEVIRVRESLPGFKVLLDPAIGKLDVVIGEDDEIRLRGGNAGVAGMRQSLFLLKKITEMRIFIDEPLDQIFRVIRRVVVYDKNFVGDPACLLPMQRFERIGQEFATIVGTKNDRNIRSSAA